MHGWVLWSRPRYGVCQSHLYFMSQKSNACLTWWQWRLGSIYQLVYTQSSGGWENALWTISQFIFCDNWLQVKNILYSPYQGLCLLFHHSLHPACRTHLGCVPHHCGRWSNPQVRRMEKRMSGSSQKDSFWKGNRLSTPCIKQNFFLSESTIIRSIGHMKIYWERQFRQ